MATNSNDEEELEGLQSSFKALAFSLYMRIYEQKEDKLTDKDRRALDKGIKR